MSSLSGKIWHRRKSERPQEIRNAAEIEFATKGFEAATMGSIAERAGITKGTIYLYYRNKQALFESLQEVQQPEEGAADQAA